MINLGLKIYQLLIACYPKIFRTKFGTEMQDVFTQTIKEAAEQSQWTVMAIYLHELREMPLNLAREHWRSLIIEEFPMTIIKKPEWSFYRTWIILTMLCVPVVFILDLIILKVIAKIVGDFIFVDGVRHITEDYLFMYTFIPILGLLTVLLQYRLLHRYLPRMGWWVIATTGGWLLGAFLILISRWLSFWTYESFYIDLAFIVIRLSIGVGLWLLALGFLPTCVTAVMLALFINPDQSIEPRGA